MEFLSQSKQPPSKLSKNLNLNRKPSCNSLRSFLPNVLLNTYWSKTLRFVHDYTKGDFEGLRTALSAIILFSIIANDDINTDWHQWKDTFLVAVSDYIQAERLEGAVSWEIS